MIARLAGFDFEISPDDKLKDADRAAIAKMCGGPPLDGGILRRVEAPPWRVILDAEISTSREPGDSAPVSAAVSIERDRVFVDHREFQVDVDLTEREARLSRRPGYLGGLEVAMRVSLVCRLPLSGGLPLHAAAVSTRQGGVVFFGPSGAGKSTIAGLSPDPVLSDELVVVAGGDPFEVSGSGSWGSLDRAESPQGYVPLRALVELRKGSEYSLTSLAPREALLRLMGVVTMPASPALWRGAMGTLRLVLDSVPVYRMAWNPAEPPWERLHRDLGRVTPAGGMDSRRQAPAPA